MSADEYDECNAGVGDLQGIDGLAKTLLRRVIAAISSKSHCDVNVVTIKVH